MGTTFPMAAAMNVSYGPLGDPATPEEHPPLKKSRVFLIMGAALLLVGALVAVVASGSWLPSKHRAVATKLDFSLGTIWNDAGDLVDDAYTHVASDAESYCSEWTYYTCATQMCPANQNWYNSLSQEVKSDGMSLCSFAVTFALDHFYDAYDGVDEMCVAICGGSGGLTELGGGGPEDAVADAVTSILEFGCAQVCGAVFDAYTVDQFGGTGAASTYICQELATYGAEYGYSMRR